MPFFRTMMKKRKPSRFTASFFVMTLLSQSVHAEINQEALSNTIDVLGAIARVAIATPKGVHTNMSPTAEQRAAIIGEIARGAAGDNDAIQQNIVEAQSPIQSVLEAASCVQSNRVSTITQTPFMNRYVNFMDSIKITNPRVVNVCADTVRVGQWHMPSPEVLEFTAMFHPDRSEQLNTWQFKIKRQDSGIWQLESKAAITVSH